MSSFNARLRLPGHTRLPLGVEVDILNERMTLTAGERTVANWPLEQLDIVVRADGFHIRVDGEEMVLNVTDSKAFAAALGIEASPVRPVTAGVGQTSTSLRPTAFVQPTDPELEDLRRRISDFARDLAADAVPPADVFARWLRLRARRSAQPRWLNRPTQSSRIFDVGYPISPGTWPRMRCRRPTYSPGG